MNHIKQDFMALSVLVMSVLAGCTTDEFDHTNLSGQEIIFSTSLTEDWNVTRSAMEWNARTEAQELGEGLYLHTVVQARSGDTVTRGQKYEGIGNEGNKTLNTSETFYVSGYRYASGESVDDVGGGKFHS